MFWIIAAVVAVLLALVWWWSGRHTAVRGYARGRRIDRALENDESGATLLRQQTAGGAENGVF